MQIKRSFLISLILFILAGCESTQPTPVPVAPTSTVPPATTATPLANLSQLRGPYLGQQPPGMDPARFASSFIKGELHTSPVFMPDGSEVYWSSQGDWPAQESRIYTMRLENGYWTQPEKIAFSDSLIDYRDPFISPSGDKLFFLSRGKLPDSDRPEKENIWFVERVGNGWGEPQPLGEEVNGLTLHWQLSVAASGNLYFTSGETGFEELYISKYIDHRYVKAEPLGAPINTEQYETTPYIAPDESYLIFARLKDQNSYPRLYISYADSNHKWGEPVLIKNISYGLCPIVSPDGKYLFFLSSPKSISWINTQFIEGLKAQPAIDSQSSETIPPASPSQTAARTTLDFEKVVDLELPDSFINTIHFSPDGNLLASAGDDGTVRVWDLRTNVNITTIQTIKEAGAVAFSPDGNLIVFSIWGEGLQVWSITRST